MHNSRGRLGRLLVGAAVIAASGMLVPTAAPVEAEPSDGLHACDHRPNFDGIPCREVDRAISESAAEFRVDDVKLRKIVRCESRFDPRADSGEYKGLFQARRRLQPPPRPRCRRQYLLPLRQCPCVRPDARCRNARALAKLRVRRGREPQLTEQLVSAMAERWLG